MIILATLKMFFMTIIQNASFTLVSRARNSASIAYHAFAAILSNGMWLIVAADAIRTDKWYLKSAYVMGGMTGSILMHWVSLHYIEKNGFDFKRMGTDLVRFFHKCIGKQQSQQQYSNL